MFAFKDLGGPSRKQSRKKSKTSLRSSSKDERLLTRCRVNALKALPARFPAIWFEDWSLPRLFAFLPRQSSMLKNTTDVTSKFVAPAGSIPHVETPRTCLTEVKLQAQDFG